jgi:hypothetical protein
MLAQTLRSTGLAAARAAQISCNAVLIGEQNSFGWTRDLNTRTSSESLVPERIQWVFLGPPGVGKGTYSTRVAVALGVAHIAAGDLVRGEIKSGSATGKKVRGTNLRCRSWPWRPPARQTICAHRSSRVHESIRNAQTLGCVRPVWIRFRVRLCDAAPESQCSSFTAQRRRCQV